MLKTLAHLFGLRNSRIMREKGAEEEIKFWDHYFATKGEQFPGEWASRMNPLSVLSGYYAEKMEQLLCHFPVSEIKMLDVGSGPLSSLDKTYAGTRLNIIAVDPLADEYKSLYKKYDVQPLINVLPCAGEELIKLFSPQSFHWIHARNSIDHALCPVTCIKQMLELVKPHGIISLIHAENEATHADFDGFHQWNFFEKNGDFMIRGNGKTTSVKSLLSPEHRLEVARVVKQDYPGAKARAFLEVTIYCL